jgi:hypothetical protein
MWTFRNKPRDIAYNGAVSQSKTRAVAQVLGSTPVEHVAAVKTRIRMPLGPRRIRTIVQEYRKY